MRAVLARVAVLAGAFTAGAVAARAATLPHLRSLTADLQRSRERILASREEERRRLRHDLHDGLGPTLASIAMSLDAARITLAVEPERTDPLLAEVRDRLARAVGEIRELAHGLRPPALDDLGLVAAIESFAEGCCGRVDVRFDGEHLELPAAVEVAAYRIVQEALTNVRLHAPGSTATVRLSRDSELRVVVADTGPGLPDAARNGGQGSRRGLAAMKEWAAEVGGHCSITSRNGGGTIVSARLPLATAETAARYHRPSLGKDGRR
ncbi:histidine kinase/DNA gyrase B/HSP90-like ATPase [Actinomadura hallensis]|uniref:Oxygen sensor histidine kinase NreB n=1 Tax=Actinomadura hallensis TaxID=337895 RepID=A0A543IBR6_9ACTN|nr:sensor histidine kinase [Actinomadura hallensis]TQM68033.1 histidine kinase/DNA gyrase B/HSP90-like ATPase [Actinomadura hallensis]HLV73879.1 sensor histidine kinase [Vulgatibacteraceae bacterium]